MLTDNTIYIHKSELPYDDGGAFSEPSKIDFESCEICDELINEENPGKRIETDRFIIHVCDKCSANPDYQDILSRSNIESIKTLKYF